jgi:hypothetical protein
MVQDTCQFRAGRSDTGERRDVRTGDEGTRGEAWLCRLLVVVAVAGVAAGVLRETAIDCPDLNDSALHLSLTLRASEALAQGANPLDFWYPDVALGFPVFRHYQHLPHLVLVAVHRVFGGHVALSLLYRVSLAALLSLFPLSVFVAARRLGLSRITAACSALVAPLISTPHLYGLSFESYLWGGSGLYAQLFASILLPLALAESYRAVSSGKGLWLAALLIAALFLSQLVYGYIASVSTLAFLVPREGRRERAIRLAVLLVTAFLVGSYFLVPAVRDSLFVNHSIWEKQEKWDSLGAKAILTYLGKGSLLDQGRIPVLTLLGAVGLVHAWRRGSEQLKLIAGLFVAWLVLYFGRTTWGMLIDLAPMAREIPLHRFIGAVHILAILLAGSGLAVLVRLVGFGRSLRGSLAAIALTAVLLTPAVRERGRYLNLSLGWKRDAKSQVAVDTDLGPLLDRLGTLDGGRVYVGNRSRPAELLRVGGIPLTAFCLVRGIDTLGFLWHSMTFVGDVQGWFNPDSERDCRLFGVRYLVFETGRRPPPFTRPAGDYGRFHLYEVPRASYFGLASVPFAVSCQSKRRVYDIGYAWLKSDLPALNVYPSLTLGGKQPKGIGERPLDVDDPAKALSAAGRTSRPLPGIVEPIGHWACRVDAAGDTSLVFRIGYHPALAATIDEQRVPVFPVAPGFTAVQVPRGRHTVQFAYASAIHWPWFVAGMLAMLLAGPAARFLGARSWRLPSLRFKPALPGKFGLVLLLALLAGRPLLQAKELAGHDSVQYLTQLVTFDECVRDGQIPPRWSPSLAGGGGAPFFEFYPPVLLIVAEIVHLVGFGLISSINLATFILLATGGALMYLFGRDRWGEGAGLVAAGAYLFAPYLLMDLYVRHAFLEVSSFAWMPLAAWGVARGNLIRTAVASALLLLSHPATALFFVPSLLIYAFATKTVLRTGAGLALGAVLASWHWVPAMMERGHLKVGDVIHGGYLNYSNHFAYLDQLVWSPWGYGLSVAGPNDGMSFRVGLAHLAAVILALALLKTRESRALVVIAALGAFFATTVSKPVWDAVPLLHPVQFPWRALCLVVFASAALSGMLLGRWPLVATAVFVALGLPLALPQGYRSDVDERQFTPERIARLYLHPGTGGIFEPRSAVPQRWKSERVRVLEGNARIVQSTWGTDWARIELVASEPSRIRFEVNAFPGWAATVSGSNVPIGAAPDGRIVVPVDAGEHTVSLQFKSTPIRRWSGLLSLGGLAVAAWLAVRALRSNRVPLACGPSGSQPDGGAATGH